MTKICMYFQVHQPFRLSSFNYFSRSSNYFDEDKNRDIFDETYSHSLAYLIPEEEFKEQVRLHSDAIKEIFGHKALVFRNTEAMISNDMAQKVEKMGYRGIVGEGWDKILGWRSPNYIYQPNGSDIKLLLRNYRLSDDVGFRFSTPDWKEYPLMADKYAMWLASSQGQTINLFLDYETFGEHQWKETGIFDFLEHLPKEVAKYPHLEWAKISDLVEMESK